MKIKKGPPHPPRCWKDQRARLISRSPWSKKSGLYSMWFCYGKKPTRFCSLPIILNLVWKINKRCLSFRNTSCYHKKSTRISRGTTSGSIWKINKSCLTVTWRCPILFIFQWVCTVVPPIQSTALCRLDQRQHVPVPVRKIFNNQFFPAVVKVLLYPSGQVYLHTSPPNQLQSTALCRSKTTRAVTKFFIINFFLLSLYQSGSSSYWIWN